MKKNLMKKVFAVTLSVALACSLVPATNPVTASAAASVKLKTARKTLQVGDKYKLTLKNNTLNWKVKKATSADSKIAKVYKVASKYVKVKGKSEGKAVVKVRVKTTKRKKNNVKTMKCTFTVKDNSTPTPTPDPTPDPTPGETEKTVKTQEELDAALADKNIVKITVDTTESVKFVIKEGSYTTVDLIVNAPNADFENNAVFKNVTIQAIKGETRTEKAKGNIFKVLAKIASIIVDKDATVSSIDFTAADGNVKLVVNGTVTTATVSAKTKVAISGESKTAVNVKVTTAAKGAEVESAVPVKVEASADMTLNLKEGAEKSELKMVVADVKVSLDNKTKEPVKVTTHDNKESTVAAGRKQDVSSPANGSTVTPPTTNPGTTTPANKQDYKGEIGISTVNVIINTGASVQVRSGAAGVVSEGSLSFTVSGAEHTSGAAIECSAVLSYNGKTKYLNWRECNKYEEEGKKKYSVTFEAYPFVASGDVKIDLSYRVKATGTTKESEAVKAGQLTINIDIPKLEEKDYPKTFESKQSGTRVTITDALKDKEDSNNSSK